MSSNENRELAAERLERLRALLRRQPVLRVDEIAAALRVSPATARRDLARLASAGDLRRVHGGAVRTGGRLEEPVFEDKASQAVREKQRIAAAAFRLIGPKESVFLDGGSTVLALAVLLAGRGDLTVVTNSLRVAAELAGSGPRLILIGGELRRLSQTFVGPLTRFLLDPVHVDRAFMGTIGLSLADGLTTTDPQEAYTKSLVMAHARQVVLLADSSKLDKVSFARFGGLGQVHVMITDKGIGARRMRKLEERKIKVIAA